MAPKMKGLLKGQDPLRRLSDLLPGEHLDIDLNALFPKDHGFANRILYNVARHAIVKSKGISPSTVSKKEIRPKVWQLTSQDLADFSIDFIDKILAWIQSSNNTTPGRKAIEKVIDEAQMGDHLEERQLGDYIATLLKGRMAYRLERFRRACSAASIPRHMVLTSDSAHPKIIAAANSDIGDTALLTTIDKLVYQAARATGGFLQRYGNKIDVLEQATLQRLLGIPLPTQHQSLRTHLEDPRKSLRLQLLNEHQNHLLNKNKKRQLSASPPADARPRKKVLIASEAGVTADGNPWLRAASGDFKAAVDKMANKGAEAQTTVQSPQSALPSFEGLAFRPKAGGN